MKVAVFSADLKSTWTLVRGRAMHSRTGSEPPPPHSLTVILVHGMVVSSRYMVPTARLLAPLCRVYTVDLPGYGKSCKPSLTLQIPQLADALADWMEAMDIPKAHLVGNSAGCQILAEFVLRYPQRVDRLVLQAPTIDPKTRVLRKQAYRLMISTFYYDSAFMTGIMIKDFLRAGFRRSVETVMMFFEDKIEEKLPHIPMPTLIVRGANDPLVPQRWVEEATALLPRGELRVIPEAGHTLNFSAPLEFVRVMRPFLRL